MDDAVQLISDGEGLAIIGEASAVERFLAAESLESRELDLQRLRPIARNAAVAAETYSGITAASARWVKLTEESAAARKAIGLMRNKETGLEMGVVFAKGQARGIKGIVQFENTSFLANPAMLSGAAGIMAQLALEQAMAEIADYLAVIDEKVDDVLRAQKDAMLAGMIGVDLVIAEAMTIRNEVGRVSEVTWSKVQASSATIAQTQAYALRQLGALADKLESKAKVGDLAKAAKKAETTVREWLAVLAQCFQLQDALAILELDRVLDSSPHDLDQHRLGLRSARKNRMQVIARSTAHLMARVDAAAEFANAKVLLSPLHSRAVVSSSNAVATKVIEFHGRLGIEDDRDSLQARRWMEAAEEAKEKAVDTVADGMDAVGRVGSGTLNMAKSTTGKLTALVAERTRRRRDEDRQPEIES
jgi:hypothetical protein